MSKPEPPDQQPLNYETPPPARSELHKLMETGTGVVGSWLMIFIATFLGMLTGSTVAAIAIAAAAVLLSCAIAWSTRTRRPYLSTGAWIGTGVGLLHAGLCFAMF
jgi:hypothetical protein